MSYFNAEDHKMLLNLGDSGESGEVLRLHQRLSHLHQNLYSRLRQYNIRLTPYPQKTEGISNRTNTTPVQTPTLTLTYMRSAAEALNVERIMGREAQSNASAEIRIQKHPVIELRLTPEHFVIELVIPPEARHDQQNLVGKLSIQQHRHVFYTQLAKLKSGYSLGFWGGNHLDELHMDSGQIPPSKVFFQYMDTFAAGRDYFRLGRWFEAGDELLDEENIQVEVFNHLKQIHTIYEFVLWSSNNNFQSFYRKAISRP